MLSQTTEYALRAMVTLAASPGRAQTAQQIARASKIPADYLAKILGSLGRAGLVTAQRGRGGGFKTMRPAEEITVLDIVDAVDPLKRIKVCPLGLPAHARRLCPLHSKLDDAIRSVQEAFASTTLASVAGESFMSSEEKSRHVAA